MSGLTYHGACGKGWKQRGNRTGHCSGCHETFEGLALFDAHQRRESDGSLFCVDPASMKFRGEAVRLVEGTWRGPSLPKGTFGSTGASAVSDANESSNRKKAA